MMPSIEWMVLNIIPHYLKSTHFITQHFNPLLFIQLNLLAKKKGEIKNIRISSWWWLYVDAKCDENINQFTNNPRIAYGRDHNMKNIFFSLSEKRNHNKKGWCMDFHFHFLTSALGEFKLNLWEKGKGYWKYHQFIANEIWISWSTPIDFRFLLKSPGSS